MFAAGIRKAIQIGISTVALAVLAGCYTDEMSVKFSVSAFGFEVAPEITSKGFGIGQKQVVVTNVLCTCTSPIAPEKNTSDDLSSR